MRPLINKWKLDFVEFREALKSGKGPADDRVERSLFHRALGYSYDAVKIFCNRAGEVTKVPYREHVPPDTTACIFWLKNRRSKEWRDVQKHEHQFDFENMNAAEVLLQPQSLETLGLLARKIARLRLLEQKERHQGPGGLIEFVKDFWRVLEPETPFVNGWPLEAMCLHLEAVTAGEVNRLLINVPPGFMKSLLTEVFWPAWEWGPMKKTHYRYISFSYSASLTERDNDRFRTLITCPQYQALYGPINTKIKTEELPYQEFDDEGKVVVKNKTITKVINTRTGWKLASSVGGVATGERGDRVIIDDPHSVVEAESDRVRSETIRWFRESISSRFNNLDSGALIIIMQRVHYDDVSGIVLGPQFDYCHLMIPWEFDPQRAFDANGNLIANSIGWFDPRADADNPDANAGEPAWTERFSEKAIARLRSEGGPYAWCTQPNPPVLMGDLSQRPISTLVRAGDEVVGFITGQNRGEGLRSRHTVAKVLSVSKSQQEVVRITLDSGEVVRCTRDHKWWTGRSNEKAGRKAYDRAYAPGENGNHKTGSVLHRVCPVGLPWLQTEDDLHLAGWLAGFFDGEGTVGIASRRADERLRRLFSLPKRLGKTYRSAKN